MLPCWGLQIFVTEVHDYFDWIYFFLQVLSVLFVPSHLVALMTLGVNTGLVLDLGHKEATLMPIYEGVVVFQAWQALPLGGRLIERHVYFGSTDSQISLCEAFYTIRRNVKTFPVSGYISPKL